MDTAKVGVGEAIAGISALALFVFMFLPWYGVDAVDGVGVGTFGGSASAWEVFSFVDILLFLICVLVVGVVIVRAMDQGPELPLPSGQLVALAGGVAVVLVLFRLVFTPGVDTGGVDVDVDLGRKLGVFIGLLASIGIAYGGWRAMGEDRQGGPPPSDSPPPPGGQAA